MRIFHVLLLVTFLSCVPRHAFAGLTESTTSPAVAPVPVMTPVPPGTSLPAIAVAEPSAPPQWAQNLIVAAEKLPWVGPIVAKALLYTGILSGILTTLVATILGILNTLMGVFNVAGLVNLAATIARFRDGKFMYWLKFFSLFNATKKPAPPQ